MERWKQRFIDEKIAKGLSFEELAARLQRRGKKITPGGVAHWFRNTAKQKNKRDINVADLILICEVSGIEIVNVFLNETVEQLVQKKLQKLADEQAPIPRDVPPRMNNAVKNASQMKITPRTGGRSKSKQ